LKRLSLKLETSWISVFTVAKEKNNIHSILIFRGRKCLIIHKGHNKNMSILMKPVIHNSPPDPNPSYMTELRCHTQICPVDSVPFEILSMDLFYCYCNTTNS
jgi:hypothetical protein